MLLETFCDDDDSEDNPDDLVLARGRLSSKLHYGAARRISSPHSLHSFLQGSISMYYNVVNIDSDKIKTSLIIMRDCPASSITGPPVVLARLILFTQTYLPDKPTYLTQ